MAGKDRTDWRVINALNEKREREAFLKRLDDLYVVIHGKDTDFALITEDIMVIEAYETLMNPQPFTKHLNIPS